MNTELQRIMETYNSLESGHTEPNYYQRPDKILNLSLKYNISSIFDSGCKDRTWIKNNSFAAHNIKYIGGEISLPQVNRCHVLFPDVTVIHHDCTTDPFPEVDMILSSDVAIHLSNVDKLKFIKNFINSGVEYLLMTDSGINSDNNRSPEYTEFPMAHVSWYQSPWNFPKELDSISDQLNDKRLKLWHRDQLVPVIEKINL